MGRVLERGLAADGRLVKFTVFVSDRPGSIAKLTAVISEVSLMLSIGTSNIGVDGRECQGYSARKSLA